MEKEELEEYRKHSLLLGAYLNSQLMGLIGAKKKRFLGFSSLCMGEILIEGQYRKQGYGILLQKMFLNMNQDQFEIVWGNIDHRNLPSLKTADRVGRKIICSEYFIPLA